MGVGLLRDGAKRDLARSLRKGMTGAERALWLRLRLQQLGVKFRRQHPIGPYVVDFACLERGLVVEVDGGQHNGSVTDEKRDRWLAAQGYRVVRYWNDDVLIRTGDVVEDIARALTSACPHPNLSGPSAQPPGVLRRANLRFASAPHHPPQAREGAKA